MSEAMDRQVLVVRIPDRSTLDEREFRDYVDESIALGKLVIRESITLEFMTFPALGGVQVLAQGKENKSGATLDIDLSGTGGLGYEYPLVVSAEYAAARAVAQNEAAKKAEAERMERKAIIERLRRYRQLGGLGCFNPLADKCGVSADDLRDIHNGSVPADLKQLRKIAKGLDKLKFETEPKEPANG